VPAGTLDTQALLALPLFSGLLTSELAGLEANLTTEHHPPGAYLFRRGDFGDALYVVVSGQIALEHRLAGHVELLGLCAPGDWFGELALLTGGPRTADARVTVGAEVLRVSRAVWTELGLRAPRLFARLCERLSRQLRATNEPSRAARRAVVACRSAGDGAAPWLEELERSIRRQFPSRPVHVLGRDGGTADRAALEHAVAGIVVPDALILLAGGAEELADRQLERRGAREWVLEPGRAGRPRDVIRGATPTAALDRVARAIAGGTIALALGAGGAYGFAHLGMLRALDAAGVPVDCVAGTSMGAIVGSALAAGAPVGRLIAFAESIGSRYRSIVLRDLDLRGPALLKGRAVMRLLAELDELREGTFESSMLPFVAIAMDLRTGEEVVLDSGALLPGIAPSFAMPGIFPCCVAGERVMVDGAMVNPVPVDRARGLGADFVIAAQPIPPLQPAAVDPVGGLLGGARRLVDLLPLRRLRHTIEQVDVLVRSFQSLWFHLATVSALGADANVCPDLRQFWFLQFGQAGPIIEAGQRAAEAALPDLCRALEERIGWSPAR